MKQLKDQMRQYLTISIPKPFKHRAQTLFDSIQSQIKINDRREILDNDDKVIENSHLDDIIQHAVKDGRKSITTTGWCDCRSITL